VNNTFGLGLKIRFKNLIKGLDDSADACGKTLLIMLIAAAFLFSSLFKLRKMFEIAGAVNIPESTHNCSWFRRLVSI
jgi:hypothetical protein